MLPATPYAHRNAADGRTSAATETVRTLVCLLRARSLHAQARRAEQARLRASTLSRLVRRENTPALPASDGSVCACARTRARPSATHTTAPGVVEAAPEAVRFSPLRLNPQWPHPNPLARRHRPHPVPHSSGAAPAAPARPFQRPHPPP
eukprot:9492536-Pyramimonas_sp.AAC.1